MSKNKEKMICFRITKEQKRKLMLYAFDNDTSIQEIFEDYAIQLIEEQEDEGN